MRGPETLPEETIEADFAVFAGGVNRSPGMDVASDPLFAELQADDPRAAAAQGPPGADLRDAGASGGDPDVLLAVDGEVHFAQYGSKDLHIEMSSLIPKQNWVTVVLLGKSIDRAPALGVSWASCNGSSSCRTSAGCSRPGSGSVPAAPVIRT